MPVLILCVPETVVVEVLAGRKFYECRPLRGEFLEVACNDTLMFVAVDSLYNPTGLYAARKIVGLRYSGNLPGLLYILAGGWRSTIPEAASAEAAVGVIRSHNWVSRYDEERYGVVAFELGL